MIELESGAQIAPFVGCYWISPEGSRSACVEDGRLAFRHPEDALAFPVTVYADLTLPREELAAQLRLLAGTLEEEPAFFSADPHDPSGCRLPIQEGGRAPGA